MQFCFFELAQHKTKTSNTEDNGQEPKAQMPTVQNSRNLCGVLL
jgi:hypothetical protein